MNAIIPLAQGFEEIEAVTIVDILRRAEINALTVALDRNKRITASRHVVIMADDVWDDTASLHCDALVLPGGAEGSHRLGRDSRVLKTIRERVENNLLVGAICAAPLVLQKAGVLKSRSATCHPGCVKDFTPGDFRVDPVVHDPPIVTSRGPGTSIRFALKIVELLAGNTAGEKVAAGLVL